MGIVKKTWNEKYWDKDECKALRGIAAIGIILHHLAQKTAAPWVPAEYFVHGLDPFVNLGYILVGIFFFCSGYGLYLSFTSKSDYLKGFIGSHFRPIVFCYVIANCVFYLVGGGVFSNYNWYIYAILYLYLAFYLCFRYVKKERTAIILLVCSTLLYIVVCDFFVVGTWCYNTVGVFTVGLVFAKYREKIIESIRRRFPVWLAASFAVTAAGFAGALVLSSLINNTEVRALYNVFRLVTVLLQFIASSAFPVLLFAANQKISVKCRVLTFLGSLSLELYLIHVTFVEMFSYYFVNENFESAVYIRNPFLYALVVLVLSVLSAYALSWLQKGWMFLLKRYENIFAAIRKDIKKVVIGILICIAVVTVYTVIVEAVREPELLQKDDEYQAKYNQMLNIDGQEISVYIAGEGDTTVLILAGYQDPCPTIMQKFLADELAKEYRVVVIDRPGTGFSGDHVTERTVENICSEIHAVAETLGLRDYILLTEEITSIYSPYYVNKYPSEVRAVVTLDAENARLGREGLKFLRQSMFEYERGVKRKAEIYYVGSRLQDKLGYRRMLWPIYRDMYTTCIDWHDEDVIYSRFFKKQNNSAYTDEQSHLIANYLEAEEYTYPSDVAVLDFASDPRRRGYKKRGIDLYGILDELSGNSYKHEIVNSVQGLQLILGSPQVVREHLDEFLGVQTLNEQAGDTSADYREKEMNADTSMKPTAAELVGVHAGYAFVPIDGNVYRYECITSDNAEKYTLGALLLNDHETDYDADVLWSFYELKEYPGHEVITGDVLCRTLFEYSPAIGTGEAEIEDAARAGFVVSDDYVITGGREQWADFIQKTEKGEPASVKIAKVYRNDRLNMSEELREATKEDSPSLFMVQLTYDGETYLMQPVHKIDGEYVVHYEHGYDNPECRYKYLMHYSGPAEYSFALYSYYDRYVLTDDDTVTWADIESGYLSSTYDDYISHEEVLCEYEWR